MEETNNLDKNLLETFIIEGTEHLEIIDNQLMELETAIKSGQTPPLELFNIIFRSMHTLKGSAGINKLATLERFAHLSETILDKLRKNLLSPSLEITEILFKCHDTLSQIIEMVKKTSSDNFNIKGITNNILKMFPDISYDAPKPKKTDLNNYIEQSDELKNLISYMPHELQAILKEYEINRINEILNNKQNLYWIKLYLNHDCLQCKNITEKNNESWQHFLQNLQKYGELIVITPLLSVLPVLENFKSKDFDIPLALLFSSENSPQKLSEDLKIPVSDIAVLSTNKVMADNVNQNAISTIITPDSVMKALVFLCGNQLFAVPLNTVFEIYRAKANELNSVNKVPVIKIREYVIPVFFLDKIYDIKSDNKNSVLKSSKIYIVVVKSQDQFIGIIVEKLIGQEEITVFELSHPLENVEGISGSAIMKDGNIALVINVSQLASNPKFK